jgi:DNA-binding IclR family transcriptional regulator
VVLAAYAPEIEAEVLAGERVRLTPRSTVAKTAVRVKFAEVRRAGYAVSIEDYMTDVSAVAAPVLDASGRAIASLSVGGPANRFTEPGLDQIIAKVKEFADELSSKMDS